MKPLKVIFIYVILAMSVLLVFRQVRDFDFVNYDDGDYVFENQHVLNGLTFDGVVWAFTTGHAANWHPMTWLSLMLDCQLFGCDPGWIHLVNVFLHLGNTLLLFAVLKKMTGSLWPSVFVAAAFALHPMHVESVAWIAERKDMLSTFFLLLTVAAYAGYVKRPSVFRYMVTLVLFALGLMTKPMLVTLPFILLLLDYWPGNRFEGTRSGKISSRQMRKSTPAAGNHSTLYRLIIEKIPFAALSVISSVITFLVQRSSGAMKGMDVIGVKDRVFNAAIVYFEYIKKMFWPKDLAVFYPLNVAGGIPFRQFALCVLLLIGVTLLVLFLGRRRKYLPVGWFWFVGTLIPVIGLVQVGSQAYADRYSYIPYIGLFIMIAWGLPELFSKWPYRKAVLGILMVIVLMSLGICSRRQVTCWNNSFGLFLHASKVTQNNCLAYNNLGAEYGKLGRYPEAIEAFKQATRIKPDYAEAYNNLGVAYGILDRCEEAMEAFKQTIRIKPDYTEAQNNLGLAYYRLGRYEEAVEAHKQTIRIKPDYADAYNNLGVAYYGLGRYEEAIEAYKQTIKIRPDDAKAYNNLGVACGGLGRYEEAIEACKQAIKNKPEYAEAHHNLGKVYSGLGRYEEAIEAFSQAIKIKPDYTEAYNNLGVAYFSSGRYEEAIEAFSQTIKIKPDYAEAYNNLGAACGGLGRYEEAVEAHKQAVKIKPDYAEAYSNLGNAYYSLGCYQESIKAFKQAVRILPNFAGTHYNLGLAYLEVSDSDSAMGEYKILKTLDTEMANKLFNMVHK